MIFQTVYGANLVYGANFKITIDGYDILPTNIVKTFPHRHEYITIVTRMELSLINECLGVRLDKYSWFLLFPPLL